MPATKYYDGIEAAQKEQAGQDSGATREAFDLDILAPKGWVAKLRGRITGRLLGPLYAFSRKFMPLMPLLGMVHVTREKQVREILQRPEDFEVPFGPEMKELGAGATFILGLEGPEHDRFHAILRKVLRREDNERIEEMATKFADALLENSAGQIDVINDLLKRVPAEICMRYFGIYSDNVDHFADWTIAISALLFGDPYGDPQTRKLAMNARWRLSVVIDDAISRVQRLYCTGALTEENADTLVERLVLVQQNEPLSDKEIRALLIGLAAGFVPTNTLGSANMLLELLKRPKAMAMAREAAMNDDHESMRKIVLEAGRLNPTLAPGQWRYCKRDTTITVGGKTKTIREGTTLLVSTMSALRDPRAFANPKRFSITRTRPDGTWQEPDLLFGTGPHSCMGKYQAIAQISALLSRLLKCDNLRPVRGKAGKLKTAGPFPRHLEMTYDTPSASQSMFLVIAPLAGAATKEDADEQLALLGNPASEAIRERMDQTGLVHFASLAALETDNGPQIIFELSTDGDIGGALDSIAAQASDYLRPIFKLAGLGDGDDLAKFLRDHAVELHGKMWGATGLNFNGLGEFPVRKVEKQAQFADFAGRVLRDYVATETARGSHPTLAIAHLRQVLRGDLILKAEATPAQLNLMAEAKTKDFDAFALMTDNMRLKLSKFRPKGNFSSFMAFMRSRDARPINIGLLVLLALSGIIGWQAIGGGLASKLSLVPLIAILMTASAVAILIGALIFVIRRAEARDVPNENKASLAKLRMLMETSDPPGYQQNHVLVYSRLKKGGVRTFLFAFALWGIRVLITSLFRPGLVFNMGTIHYARWGRIPGTRNVIFYANFDGSWENYLEDFITRASQGQTAAWSNWEDFPKTDYLVYNGARDSDAFKRWVRTKQQPVPFWYSRFPELTTMQMRNNGLIHAGAGLASNATESEEWIRCFSSMPRTENLIETDEVQALVFRGMKRLPYSVCLAVKLPPAGPDLGEWLCWIRGKAMRIEALLPQSDANGIQGLVDERILVPVPRPSGQADEYALAHAMTIAFGDRPLTGRAEGDVADPVQRASEDAMAQAVFVAISAAGFYKFSAPNCNAGSLQESFPEAFRMGMAVRNNVLGDLDENAPVKWRWNDDPDAADATEAALMLYASDTDSLAKMVAVHSALLENHGGHIISTIDCAPAWKDTNRADFEHFGYRDGISQPVIKGTSRSIRSVPQRDIVEPGEFILGYRNNSGYFPQSSVLRREADLGDALPVVIDDNLSRYPDFGDESLATAARDLGRNGSFLVLRELKQDVEGFEDFVAEAAEKLNSGGFSDLYKLVGQAPDKEWVKAKLMGRWTTGRPLIGNPVFRASQNGSCNAERENDFSYGDDDPQGLACPFGAHIRRSNPRDSKEPGDDQEESISNRHRLLRRGRPYHNRDTGEKGLLFASFCTDIQRQFEFVQQFWSNAPAFHGLENEPDPIVGSCPVNSRNGAKEDRVFTIPTAAGPVRLDGLQSFVQTMGGGYFFMPGRSALSWLSDTALHARPSSSENMESNNEQA